MDRRSSFSAIFKKTATPAAPTAAPPPSGTLAPYTGPWTVKEAGHLMRRATFGPSQDMIQEAINLGVQGSVDKLLTNEVGLPDPPIKYDLDNPHPNPLIRPYIPFSRDPDVKYGDTWINAPIIVNTGDPTNDGRVNVGRLTSAYYWMYYLINQDNFSIREKMTMFWHNHFVVSDFRAPKMIYSYVKILHDNVLGDFRQMTKDITIDPSMLLYLNGAENTSAAPNENYARELLELFTVGKGDIAGPGDYTTFTEDDVREVAKVLTGWTIDPTSLQTNNIEPFFALFAHDFSTKNLSHRFNNAQIPYAGEDEYKNVIDVIFESPHVGTHLARKLYRYYVHYNITPEVETSIIEPLAQILRDNDYVVEPAIRALLSSEHFYGDEAIGCMIKNPTDFYASFVKGFGMQFDGKTSFIQLLDLFLDGPILDYLNSGILYNMASEAGMAVFFHPLVAGWKAYYQAPQYYRTWINTVTLPIRAEHSTALVNGLETTVGDANYEFNKTVPVLEFVANIPNAQDPNQLIHGIADRLFPYGVTDKQKDFLKEVLIPGLPDFEWTVEYSDYLADPSNTQLKEAVENRLRALFTLMLQMPESQLM